MPLGTKVINYASIAFGVLLGIGTGIWVYRSTMKRARMIEAEERDRSDVRTQRAGRRSQEGLMHPDEFVEDEGYEEGSGSEVLNDDIDFLDPEAGLGRYKDENDVDSEDDGLVRDGTGRSIGLGKR